MSQLRKAAVTQAQELQIMSRARLKEEWFDRSNGLVELQGRVSTAIEGVCWHTWQQVVMVVFSSGVNGCGV